MILSFQICSWKLLSHWNSFSCLHQLDTQKNIISKGLILVFPSIIWRKKCEDSFWSNNCVWLLQRERERQRETEPENIPGETPPTSHKRPPRVTSPEDVLPQADLKGRHLRLWRLYVQTYSQQYWYCYSVLITHLITGAILKASHRLVHLTLTFNQWGNWGTERWIVVSEVTHEIVWLGW